MRDTEPEARDVLLLVGGAAVCGLLAAWGLLKLAGVLRYGAGVFMAGG